MIEPATIVQKRPAKESAIKAPTKGVRLVVPFKFVSVLDASTSGMCIFCVRYVIILALKPVVANRSHILFAVN